MEYLLETIMELILFTSCLIFLPTSILGIICPPGYLISGRKCYTSIVGTEKDACPFMDNLPFWSIDNVFMLDVIWTPAEQDDDGLYVYQEKGIYYKYYFIDSYYPDEFNGQCVVFTGNSYSSSDCDTNYAKLCAWEDINTFCQVYDEICSTLEDADKCSCQSKYTEKFFCRQWCTGVVIGHGCSKCEEYFEKLPPPELHLQVDNNRILLEITSILKLKKVAEGQPVVCYGQTVVHEYMHRFSAISNYPYSFEFKHLGKRNNKTFYEITNAGDIEFLPGLYWCTGFFYPYLADVNSNIVAYKPKNVDYIFVQNVSATINKFNPSYSFEQNNLPTIAGMKLAPVKYFPNLSLVTTHFYGYFTDDFPNLESIYSSIDALYANLAEGTLLHKELCLPSVTHDGTFNLTWELTYMGQAVPSKEMCLTEEGHPVLRKCIPDLTTGASWSPAQGVCSYFVMHGITPQLMNLTYSNLSVAYITNSLHEIVQVDTLELYYYDLYLIAKILEKIANMEEKFDLQKFVEIISAVMDFDPALLKASQDYLNSTDIILSALDQATTNFANLHLDRMNLNVFTKNLNLNIFNLKHQSISGVAFYKNQEVRILEGASSAESLDKKDLIFAYFLSSELMEEILETNLDSNHVISSVMKKTTLFNENNSNYFRLTGWISSVFITDFQSKFLVHPLQVYIKPYRKYRRDHYCSFWKYGLDDLLVGVHGMWEVDHQAKLTDELHLCEFWHMTHFAMLLNNPSDPVLNVISLVGSSISIFSITAIFLTAFVSEKWFESTASKICLNSCTPIMLQMVFLPFSDLVDSYEEENLCLTVGMILHFSIISQFCWTLVIAYLQYRRFIKVFITTNRNILIVSCLVGWLIPLIPLLLTALLAFDNYLIDEYCYLTEKGLYFGVFLPVSSVAAINVAIILRIFIELVFKRTARTGKNFEDYYLYLKLGIFLFLNTGLCWVFGLLNGFLKNQFLSYMFCFSASLQGLAMFWYHIVLNGDAIAAWKKILRRVKALIEQLF